MDFKQKCAVCDQECLYCRRTCSNAKQECTMQDLLESYQMFCKQVSEFEYKNPSLRPDFMILDLCRMLHSDIIPSLIRSYDAVRYRDVTAPPGTDIGSLYKDFDRCTAILRRTCLKLLQELDRVDFSATARAYYCYVGFPGRYLPKTHFRVNTHGHEGIGACCAYINYIGTELNSAGIKRGLEMLSREQAELRKLSMESATVATLFSLVSAVILYPTFAVAGERRAWTFATACQFASLVLGVSSAANSFLGAILHQSPAFSYRPITSIQRFLQKWFALYSPTLTAISALFLLVGLSSFTSSIFHPGWNQVRAIEYMTVTFIVTTLASMLVVSYMASTKPRV